MHLAKAKSEKKIHKKAKNCSEDVKKNWSYKNVVDNISTWDTDFSGTESIHLTLSLFFGFRTMGGGGY